MTDATATWSKTEWNQKMRTVMAGSSGASSVVQGDTFALPWHFDI